MRKKVAWVLSIILWISMISVDTLQASTMRLFEYVAKKALIETNQGIEMIEVAKDAEEALFNFEALKEGKYKLAYYIEGLADNPNETTKVVVTFDVGKGVLEDGSVGARSGKIYTTIELFKQDGVTPLAFNYTEHHFPYEGDKETSTVPVTQYHNELTLDDKSESVAERAKEMSVQIGKELSIRAIVEGKSIKFWTNQIKKGYITDFNFEYGAHKERYSVFPGIIAPTISSTHLDDLITSSGDGLPSRNEIDINDTAHGGVKPGSRPGIKLAFERPKAIKYDGSSSSFVYVSDLTADDSFKGEFLNATFNLQTKLEPDDNVYDNQIQVSLNLGNSAKLLGSAVDVKDKKIHYEKANDKDTGKNKICLYFSKEDTYLLDKKDIIIWPGLKESMVVGGEVTVASNKLVHGQSLNTGNVAIKTGYTYIEYEPIQNTIGETTLVISPYKYNGEITYKVYYVNGEYGKIDKVNSLFGEYKYVYDANFPERKLEVSVPNLAKGRFMVEAVLTKDQTNAESQEVIYDPKLAVVSPYTPQIRGVHNVYTIMEPIKSEKDETLKDNEKEGNQLEAAGFTVEWSGLSEQKLKETITTKGALYFELKMKNIEDKVESPTDKKEAVIAVFKATLDKNQKVQVKQLGNDEVKVEYDASKELFTAYHVPIKKLVPTSGLEDSFEDMNLPKDYLLGIDYTETAALLDKPTILTKHIPKTFHLSMRSVLDIDLENTGAHIQPLKASAHESEAYPLTLDRTKALIESPEFDVTFNQNDLQSTLTPEKTELIWKSSDASQFKSYMLDPGLWEIKKPSHYEVILYQASYIDGDKTVKQELSDTELKHLLEEESHEVLEIDEPLVEGNALTLTEPMLQALRSGKLLKMKYIQENLEGSSDKKLTLKGLDANQSYYIKTRAVLESTRNIKKDKPTRRIDYSLFSKAYGFTVIGELKPIQPDEEKPSTPRDYKVSLKETGIAALEWKAPLELEVDDASLHYEIIRVKDAKLPEEIVKDRQLKVEEILNLVKDSTQLKTYSIVDGVDEKHTEPYYYLEDEVIQPNTLYHYYIRTSYKGNYSEWIREPLTTLNIEKPIQLKGYEVTKDSATISFLAKAPYVLVPDAYDFKIMIKEDELEWEEISGRRVHDRTSEYLEEGYYFYEYHLSHLKPGKSYQVKVSLMDKTKEKIDGEYQQSLYSNTITIRTEYDEETQDKENLYKDYLQRYDKAMALLGKKSYWLVEEGETYKYKKRYLEAELEENGVYTLISNPSSKRSTYYLPYSSILRMNTANATFKVEIGNQTVMIRPKTLLETTKEIKEAELLKKNRELEDYYIVLELTHSDHTGTINGEKCISPRLHLDMGLAYLKSKDIEIETDIEESLQKIIEEDRVEYIEDLERKVKYGKLDTAVLDELIEEHIEAVMSLHEHRVSRLMNYEIRREYSVNDIQKSILIQYKGDFNQVKGYYYDGRWNKVEVYGPGNIFYIEAKALGSYILTGGKSELVTIPELLPYQSFINKYGLEEFFKLDTYTIKKPITREALYGATAKVLGATSGVDYRAYLSGKKIKGLKNVQLDREARQDEVIYIIMQAYEVLNKRDIGSIYIQDRQSVSNIGAFQPIYRPYVYGGVALKIVTPDQKRVIPSASVSISDAIKMLYKIQA